MKRLLLMLALLVTASPFAMAEEKDKKPESKTPEPSVTHHEITLGGETFKYTATTGKLQMKDDSGKVKAEIFSVAYTRDDADVGTRPITFCFNGGPGSASVWLHLGMLGPQRVRVPDDATTPAPPYTTEHNPHSLLDVTDLVFIDPVSTGYSRPAEGEDPKQFHGYEEDLRSVGQFIHDYTTKNERWSSPKYVLGESYGGVRSAGLSGTLQDRYRMYLNGIVMISPVVDFSTIRFADNNDLPYILFLPSYTSTAWYHKQLSDELQGMSLEEVVAEAEHFAYGTYARALLQGTSLPKEQLDKAIARYAELTGLEADYVRDNNLRVSMSEFGRELLREEGNTIGRFDSRFKGVDRDNASNRPQYDPSSTAITGAFGAGMNEYMRGTLKFEDDRVYELGGAVGRWNYGRFENRYVDASETLRNQMSQNPHLKLFVACGYYDLATPQFAFKYTKDHLMLVPEYVDRVEVKKYEAGHMMYILDAEAKKLRDDLVEWYKEAQ
ncbi:S10 family peptidase [Aeoliella mucimassa]|uniref:Serine carboxypeptidase n=1 Tax=Aeoliella mucimassa TaxID=2527972 RepID=A0A518AJB1_9BACT|nr:peptidase S10 [Aeoliella mucimassa]QDU54812.1 Serine carboxypeptidase [Aeoliella mucimassa]